MDRTKQIKAMLEAIKSVESSGGKNIDHPVIDTGVNAGSRAVGQYALTPNTIREMLNRYPDLPYQDLKEKENPDIEKAVLQDRDTPPLIRREPASMEDNVASKMADYAINRQHGYMPAAIGSWNAGHNTDPEKMTDMLDKEQYLQDYVNKAMPVYEDKMKEGDEDDKPFPKLQDLLNYK